MVTVEEAREMAEQNDFRLASVNNMAGNDKEGCILQLLLVNAGITKKWNYWEYGTYFQFFAAHMPSVSAEDAAQFSHGFEGLAERGKLWHREVPSPNPETQAWKAGNAIRKAFVE